MKRLLNIALDNAVALGVVVIVLFLIIPLPTFLLDFLLIQAGITLAIGVIGLMGEPEKQIRPLIMFVPFLYAFFCVLVSFVTYSSKEISVGEMAVRKLVQFILIELVVGGISVMLEPALTLTMLLPIGLAAAIVWLAVQGIDYLIAQYTASQLTKELWEMQRRSLRDKPE